MLEIVVFDILWTIITAFAYFFWYLSFRTEGKVSYGHLGSAMLLSLVGLILIGIDVELHS